MGERIEAKGFLGLVGANLRIPGPGPAAQRGFYAKRGKENQVISPS
jgi:hypothetical protein